MGGILDIVDWGGQGDAQFKSGIRIVGQMGKPSGSNLRIWVD